MTLDDIGRLQVPLLAE